MSNNLYLKRREISEVRKLLEIARLENHLLEADYEAHCEAINAGSHESFVVLSSGRFCVMGAEHRGQAKAVMGSAKYAGHYTEATAKVLANEVRDSGDSTAQAVSVSVALLAQIKYADDVVTQLRHRLDQLQK